MGSPREHGQSPTVPWRLEDGQQGNTTRSWRWGWRLLFNWWPEDQFLTPLDTAMPRIFLDLNVKRMWRQQRTSVWSMTKFGTFSILKTSLGKDVNLLWALNQLLIMRKSWRPLKICTRTFTWTRRRTAPLWQILGEKLWAKVFAPTKLSSLLVISLIILFIKKV